MCTPPLLSFSRDGYIAEMPGQKSDGNIDGVFIVLFWSTTRVTTTMSMLRTRKTSKLKVTALSGAVIIGTAYLVLQSYPHLRKSLYNYITRSSSVDDVDELEDDVDDGDVEETDPDVERVANTPGYDALPADPAELQQWSNTNLRLWLKNVCTMYHRHSFNTNTSRKISPLLRMLLMISLFPLLGQFRAITSRLLLLLTINYTQYLFLLIYLIQKLLRL